MTLPRGRGGGGSVMLFWREREGGGERRGEEVGSILRVKLNNGVEVKGVGVE